LFGNLLGKTPKPLEFKVGDIVRISAAKLTFDKPSASERWTRELFEVYKTYNSYPTNYYILRDLTPAKEVIQGKYEMLV